jgi:SAM-dependent methyltransferase
MISYRNCPLCGSEAVTLLHRVPDYFLTGQVFILSKCSSCSFIFLKDQPVGTDLEQYYKSDEYISHNNEAPGLTNTIYRLSRSIMLRRKLLIVKNLTNTSSGSLLDIGSGTGHFAGIMKRSGWAAEGIELNDKARTFSEKEFGIRSYEPGDISRLPDEKYDCITLWHVLEHFSDPFSYIAEIRRLLKPDGIVLLALPNSSSADAVHYKEEWAAWDVPRHLWHFNPDTLRIFSDNSGFQISGIRRLPLDAFYISVLSERYRKSRLPLLKGLIKGSLFTIKSLIGKDRTSSLIYILRKKTAN